MSATTKSNDGEESLTVSVGGGKLFNRLGAAAEAVEQGTLRVDGDGLHFRGSDNSLCLLIDVTIPAVEADWDGGAVEMDVNPASIRQSAGHVASRHDELSFTWLNDKGELWVHVGKAAWVQCEVEDEDPDHGYESPEPPDVRDKHTVCAGVRSYLLHGIVSGAGHRAGDNSALSLVARDGQFSIGRKVQSEDGYTDEWPIPGQGVTEVTVEGGCDEVVAHYNEQFLRQVTAATPRDWTVTIEYGEEVPVRFEVTDEWVCWIAPRIPTGVDGPNGPQKEDDA